MILRDLAFENDHRKEQRNGELPVFNREYYLAQLYLYFLGEKFILDGCGKLTIYVKHRNDLPKYLYWEFEGTSRYYLDDNQVDMYFSIKDNEEADRLLCSYTHDVLIDIAKRSGCGEETMNRIHYAMNAIIKSNFSISYEITKCSKTNQSRKYRALVFRNINRNLSETWSVKILDKKNNDNIKYEGYVKNPPLYFNGIYRYQKTKWDGDSFLLMDNNGIIWDRINL